MKGVTHIVLSLATAILILAPAIPTLTTPAAIIGAVLFILGAFLGSITPDIDMGKGSAIFHAEIPGANGKKFFLTPIFGHTINTLCYKPVRFVFHLIFGDKIYAKHGHRELPHSPIGIFFMSVLLTFYIWLVCFALSFIPGLSLLANNPLIFVFGASFFFGCLMHLVEDTCDIAGVHYFYPFVFRRLRGKLLGDGTDTRPRVYTILLLIAAVILCASSFIFKTFAVSGILTAVVLWIIFLLVSGVPAKKQNRDLN